jgi:hypothetical protein
MRFAGEVIEGEGGKPRGDRIKRANFEYTDSGLLTTH